MHGAVLNKIILIHTSASTIYCVTNQSFVKKWSNCVAAMHDESSDSELALTTIKNKLTNLTLKYIKNIKKCKCIPKIAMCFIVYLYLVYIFISCICVVLL